jgi:hypothetical protein
MYRIQSVLEKTQMLWFLVLKLHNCFCPMPIMYYHYVSLTTGTLQPTLLSNYRFQLEPDMQNLALLEQENIWIK